MPGLYLRALVLLVAMTCTPASAETLIVGGTGAALGGITHVAAAFEARHPGTRIDVRPSLGSSGGITALMHGALHVALSSRPLKPREREAEVRAELYARTALAFVTSKQSDVDAVTLDQLERIYSGAMTRWPDGTMIRLVLRPRPEADTQILRNLSPSMAEALDMAHARKGLGVAPDDQANAFQLERLPGSIGLAALGQIAAERRNLKVLALDGVRPRVDQDGSLSKNFYIVTRSDAEALTKEFVDFVFSEQGQRILSDLDHAPVPREG